MCEKYGKFSYDHIPPKYCGNNKDVYFYSFQQHVSNPHKKFRKIHSQDGVKNKNICEACNNLLGSKFDIELGKLRDIALKSFDNIQDVDNRINTKNAIKAVFGHLISSAPNNQKSTLDFEMSNYFWDKKNSIDDKYSLYLFLYPYKSTIFLFKNYIVGQLMKSGIVLPKGLISSLYFYPFAFIVMEKQQYDRGIDLIKFSLSKDEFFQIKNDDWSFKNKRLSPIWPCDPSDDEGGSSFVMYNEKSARNSLMKH